VLAGDAELARALGAITDGRFSDGDRGLYEPLVRSLVEKDPFFVLADFRAYVECQRRVARAWQDPDAWTRTAIENVAGMGIFSSDRSIAEYARDVWKVEAVKVQAPKR
jgi:starch phosphorylase